MRKISGILLSLVLMFSTSQAEEKKLPPSAHDLLQASERLQLTKKQKIQLTKIRKRMISDLDWMVRNESDPDKSKLRTKAILAKSLDSGLKLLSPKQHALWRRSQAPDQKTQTKKKP